MYRLGSKKSIFNVRMLLCVLICFGVLAAPLCEGGRQSLLYLHLTSENTGGSDILTMYTSPFAMSSFVIFAGIFPGIPYAYSYLEERNSGYLKFILPRSGRKKYMLQKIVFSGLSGGISMAVPGILIFILLDVMSVDTTPDAYPYVFDTLMWAPIMFKWGGRLVLLLKAILLFLFGVMWSELSLMIALLVKNKYVAFVLPFFIFEALWLLFDPSVFNPIYLVRADCEITTPLFMPYLVDFIYITLLVSVNAALFRRRK